ncbi:MAG: multiheme c-type cytochrome [Coriobacteriia bacterium]
MKRRYGVALALVVVFALAAIPAAGTALPSMPSTSFGPSTGCGCHAALLGQWQPSMHAQALTDPIYLLKLKEGDEATGGAVTPFCIQCHSPIGSMSGDVNELGEVEATGVAAEGVTCTFCHRSVGTDAPIGNASQQVNPEDVRVAQLKDPQAPHAAAYSQFHETAEFCGACHNVDHPTNGSHLEATYTEWSESPYAAEGIVCQDCHQTPGAGVTKPNPGKAASMGPEREHIYSMTFAGGNVGLGDAALAEANLKAAATLELEAPEVQESGEVAVKTTITNVGAGHYLPTGLTEVRQMWLEVTATDDTGAELLSERRDFGTVLKGADGSYPVEMWDAAGIQSDDRIAPRESTTNDYSFPMATGAVTVKATLYYRSCPEEMAEEAGVEIPATTMAEVTKTVFPTAESKDAGDAAAEAGGDAGAEGGPGALLWIAIGAAVVAVAAAAVVLTRKKR